VARGQEQFAEIKSKLRPGQLISLPLASPAELLPLGWAISGQSRDIVKRSVDNIRLGEFSSHCSAGNMSEFRTAER
jgi:hypothetical protein